MKPGIRPYDLITVLGALVVLVWTPVHVAEGGGPDAPPDGHSFVLPEIRYGDRIEYELILRTSDEPAASSGPLLTLTFREPEQHEGPLGTVLVAELHNAPLHVDFGPAILTQNEFSLLHYINATGDIIGGSSTSHGLRTAAAEAESPPTPDPQDLVPVIQRSEPPEARGLVFFQLPVREAVEYEPVEPWNALADLIRGQREPGHFPESKHPVEEPLARPAPTQEDRTETAPFIAIHRERFLYATDHSVTPSRPSWSGSNLFSGFRVFDVLLEWKAEDPTTGPTQAWNWWAEDLPVQAGEHKSFYAGTDGQAERVATLDMVPASFRPGHTPAPLDDPGLHRERPEPRLTDLPTFDDTAPLVGDRSLSDIRDDLIGGRSPTSIRDLMKKDPEFTGIRWERTPTADTVYASVLLENTTHALRLHYIEGDVQIEDACEETYLLVGDEMTTDCREYPLGVAIRTKGPGVRPPDEILGDLRDRLAGRSPPDGTEFGMYRLPLSTPIPPGQGKGQTRADPFHGSYPLHEGEDVIVGRSSPRGVAVAYGFLIYPTTGHRELVYQDEAVGIGSQQSLVTASTSTAPRVVGPFGPEPIYGGLVLLLLGIVVRLWAAAKAGAHLPLFGLLYARITKDKVLDHKRREEIAELVSADPGVSLTEVAKRTGLSRTGAYHHLETLVRNRHLHVVVVARIRHYFPCDWNDPKVRLRRAVARRSEWENVMSTVEAHPGVPLHALVERLGAGKSTVSRTGARLAALGLVHKVRDGREILFYPVDHPTAETPSHAPTIEA